MYSTWDLLAAVAVTALGSHAVWIVPDWLDRRKARRQQECALPNPHDGPCTPAGGR